MFQLLKICYSVSTPKINSGFQQVEAVQEKTADVKVKVMNTRLACQDHSLYDFKKFPVFA